MRSNKVNDALLGVIVGDALGVPFEFKKRNEMLLNPATEMVGYGTYNQPPGTWSDDSSLTLCLAKALLEEFNLKTIAEYFIQWKNNGFLTARGKVFDIGMTTAISIARLEEILSHKDLEDLNLLKYSAQVGDNGNGSLMRILPLLVYVKSKPIKEQFEIIWEVSALTHRHIRAAMCCLIYLRIAEKLLKGKDKDKSYSETRSEIINFWNEMEFNPDERLHFKNIIENSIVNFEAANLNSDGYVIHSLEVSLWSFLNSHDYSSAVLTAINLGGDTDTNAAISGGLAGLYYGLESIPRNWIDQIARIDEIVEIGNAVNRKYCT